MNLRDQLVKAGLSSKKDAKKAANKLRAEKKKKKKAEQKGEVFETEAEILAKEIETKKKEQILKDKERNQQIELEREQKQKRIRALEIIYSNEDYDYKADIKYYFIEDKKIIRNIPVTEVQLSKLAKGLLGVAKESFEDESFKLLPLADCMRVMELYPELIACLHPQEAGDVNSKA